MATTKQTAATANATVDNDQRDASGYSINDYKAIYESASRENNAELMQWANNGANAIRTSQGGTAEYATQAIANAAAAGRTPATNTNSTGGYTTINQNLHNGTDSDKTQFNSVLQNQINYGNANPSVTQSMTQEEFNKLYGNVQSPTAQGYTIGQMYNIGATGQYTYDAAEAQYAKAQGYTVTPTTYSGKPAYLIEPNENTSRNQQSGTSGADESLLNAQQYAAVQYEKQQWELNNALYKQYKDTNPELAAQYQAAANQAHVNAERIRAGAWLGSYSGGADGSTYLTYGELANPDIYDFFGKNPYTGDNVYANAIGQTQTGTHTHTQTGTQSGTGIGAGSGYVGGTPFAPGTGTGTGGITGGTTGGVTGSTIPSADTAKANLMNLLEQWKTSAEAQANGQIDFAVQQAITELERALADAQPQYKEQQESIYRDEMQSLDNSALYAEARGDKGGIGQEQYNSIMNTAAQNRLSVQQAQTKLSTDTQRQIADLRAQGEFEKADKLLEITQSYLSQLISLEQWAMDYGLSVAQFQENIRQWQLNYELSIAQFNESIRQWEESFNYQQYRDQVSDNQWQQQFNHNVSQDLIGNSQWQQEFNYAQQQNTLSQLISSGNALLSAGIMPSSSQLSAMGMTSQQAQSYIAAAKLAAQNEQNLAWYKATKGNSDSKVERPSTKDQVYKDAVAMLENGASDEAIYNYLKSVSPENADVYAGFLQIEIPEKPNSTGNIGLGYFMALPQAQMMKAQGKSAQEILAYLDTFSEEELSNEGLDTILRILNLGNYNR